MNEVVEYRNCDCGLKDCPGEKQTTLFTHTEIEKCRVFMLKYPRNLKYLKGIKHYRNNPDKIDVLLVNFTRSKLPHLIRKFRVQKTIDEE